MVYLVKALLFKISGRLFTTYSTSAEHSYFLVLGRIKIAFNVSRKLSERIGLRIDRIFERSNLDFIFVAGI